MSNKNCVKALGLLHSFSHEKSDVGGGLLAPYIQIMRENNRWDHLLLAYIL